MMALLNVTHLTPVSCLIILVVRLTVAMMPLLNVTHLTPVLCLIILVRVLLLYLTYTGENLLSFL